MNSVDSGCRRRRAGVQVLCRAAAAAVVPSSRCRTVESRPPPCHCEAAWAGAAAARPGPSRRVCAGAAAGAPSPASPPAARPDLLLRTALAVARYGDNFNLNRVISQSILAVNGHVAPTGLSLKPLTKSSFKL